MRKINVLGVRFDDIDDRKLIEILSYAISKKDNFRIVTPNPEIVMAAHKDEKLTKIINESELVLKDGIGIKIAEKIKGIKSNPRQTGIETLYKIFKIANERQSSLYIVGAKQEILEKAIEKIQNTYPGIFISGNHNGYFATGSSEEDEIIRDITEKKPDVLVAAMGFPKQELFLSVFETGSYGIGIGCGGSLDVISGEVKRAPAWMQKYGLEWFYRLLLEPKRIKRQLVIPKFLFKIIMKKNSCKMEEE